jgi:hypothetical protein
LTISCGLIRLPVAVMHGSIGQYVRDLELIAKTTALADWIEQVEQLPLRYFFGVKPSESKRQRR